MHYTRSMTKSILFVLAAVGLVAAGLHYRTVSSHDARTKADQVAAQDVAGTDTTAALADLKLFVSSHMGASVSLTLQGSYDRAAAAVKASLAAQSATSQVYADAQRACSGKSDSITQARCNQNYISTHLVNQATPAPVAEPKLSDYKQTLRSPAWTPDLAGALFLGAAVSGVIALFGLRRRRY